MEFSVKFDPKHPTPDRPQALNSTNSEGFRLWGLRVGVCGVGCEVSFGSHIGS